jgi:DinB superfamily
MTEPAAGPPPLVAEDHICESCDYSYTEIGPGDAVSLISGYPRRYRETAAAIADADLRRRPDAQTWSVLEYLCHVRDVYLVHIVRVTRALTEENPHVEAMNNDTRAARGDYNGQDRGQVLDDLERNATQFADLVETVTPDQWPRLITRHPGEERTVLWLIRHAAHEGLHHLHDIDRIATTTAESADAADDASRTSE